MSPAASPSVASALFDTLLEERPAALVNRISPLLVDDGTQDLPLRVAARALGLSVSQLVCAIGFNGAAASDDALVSLLGLPNPNALAQERNRRFTEDIYKRLSFNNVLSIYEAAGQHPELSLVIQYLVDRRLTAIETRIEQTINAVVIERYRKEVKAIYRAGIGGTDFAERRLAQRESGFRALLREVQVIAEQRILPIGELFFRDDVLPEEKRRLVLSGLVPTDLVEERLADQSIDDREREALNAAIHRAQPTA